MSHVDKCKHGMVVGQCAWCSGLIQETTRQAQRKQAALDRHALTLAEHYTSVQWPTVPGLDNLFKPRIAEVNDPDKYYCSFCGRETERIKLTFGNGKPRVKLEYEQDERKQIHVKKVFVAGGKVQACPNCCLEIRQPITVSVT